jgi:hypothetical protein
VFVFILYALAVWYLCAKHRRQWRGLLWIVLGIAGVALVGFLHWRISVYFGKQAYFVVLSHMLWPYAAFVAFMGLIILTFPRRPAPQLCAACGYDLEGHDEPEPICPECGTTHTAAARAAALARAPRTPPPPTSTLPPAHAITSAAADQGQPRRPAFVLPDAADRSSRVAPRP